MQGKLKVVRRCVARLESLKTTQFELPRRQRQALPGEQMEVRLHRNLLQAAWLWALLAAHVHSCPDACSKCSGPENDQCEECRAGWTLHNKSCVDIDECDTELAHCLPNAYCLNTEGSFKCRDCDAACVGCMGSGPARCRKCATGYRLMGPKCLDIDECSDRVLACHGLDEICVNTEGSFRCDCADGFIRKSDVCVRKQLPNAQEKGLFEDIQDEEVEVLQQMFFGVILCALATLAAKGDMVYTSIFMGGVAAMAGYWLSDRGDRLISSFLKGR
ncbi:cysteine-rich with EGF-like domain protein 1 [Salarias fasciatus]|uniref:cysteine-rich with EGF-like domain protein 1 n=1 Tax=Salarias fasciatus TaxID=181472 RepID=UPI001176CABE|nr:cysteine-rich with EGF-like domain protein 1 [Salarias fasciatus]